MRVRLRKTISALVGSSFAALASAQSLTLEEAVQTALENNFDVIISRNAERQAALNYEIAQSEYLPDLSVTGSSRASERQQIGSQTESSLSETDFVTADVSQRLDTGGTVTLSSSLDKSERNSSLATLNLAYNADAAIRVIQPLLAGFGPAVARARRRLTRVELEQQRLAFEATIITVLADVEEAYHRLVFNREQLKVRQDALELAKQLLEENRAKLESGLVTSLDVLQAEVGVANAVDDLIRSEQTTQDAQDNLTTLIAIDPVDTYLETEPLEIGTINPPTYDAVYQRAIENQPRYLSVLAEIELREIELQRERRNRLPDLDLNGTYALSGLSAEQQRTYDRLFAGDSFAWQVDLRLNLPWGLKEKRATYAKAKLARESEEVRAHRERQIIVRDTRIVLRAVSTAIETLDLKKLATQLAMQEYELEKAKFDNGLSTGREVLEAQQRMNEARVEEALSKVELLDAFSNLRQLEGSTLERYGVDVVE